MKRVATIKAKKGQQTLDVTIKFSSGEKHFTRQECADVVRELALTVVRGLPKIRYTRFDEIDAKVRV
jgi:hypothetical protein